MIVFDVMLGGLGGGGRWGGADLEAFRLSGLSVTSGASVSSSDGSCCLLAGTGAGFDEARALSTLAKSLLVGGEEGLVAVDPLCELVASTMVAG